MHIIPFGQIEAKCAADIRVNLEKRGLPINPYDLLISASAKANKKTLVTHNTKEFGRIEGLDIDDRSPIYVIRQLPC